MDQCTFEFEFDVLGMDVDNFIDVYKKLVMIIKLKYVNNNLKTK